MCNNLLGSQYKSFIYKIKISNQILCVLYDWMMNKSLTAEDSPFTVSITDLSQSFLIPNKTVQITVK